MGESSFKTNGEARLYCEKFNAAKLVKPLDVFDLADALKRAYDAGLAENKKTSQKFAIKAKTIISEMDEELRASREIINSFRTKFHL